MAQPRELDQDLIDAYRARRALDYLFGFTLSRRCCGASLPGAKSAGRVQSVALRLIVEREREIESFTPQEYWSVTAEMEQGGHRVYCAAGQMARRQDRTADHRQGRRCAGRQGGYRGGALHGRERRDQAAHPQSPPPFTTSTLQQEAARKLGFSASHTMRIAQQLYEDGAITYMRTDGVQMDGSAISAARKAISDRFDGGYLPEKPRQYQTKAKNAQEAHEAIRPTDFGKERAGSGDHGRLYDLIFKRALASQMASARLERTTVDAARRHRAAWPARHRQVVIFPGFLSLYEEGHDDAEDEDAKLLPRMSEGDAPAKKAVSASSTSRSRRRAIPRLRWSSGWRSWASVARPPTRHHSGAEGPGLCSRREEPLLRRGERAAGDGVSGTLLRTLCEL
jgi:DNA topoisomerase-1